MKKTVCSLSFVLLTLCCFSQNDKDSMMIKDSMMMKDKSGMHMKKMKDCMMMKDGKMMMMKNGKEMMMDKDITLSNGTMVMKDGTLKTKDGKTMTLKEDECIYMNGKMEMMNKKKKMH